MNCPKCGGEMWDNRGKKKNPKAPDFKCKDKEHCDGVIWPPKGEAAPVSHPAQQTQPQGRTGTGNGGFGRSPETQARIERQHSQEMAIRYLAMTGQTAELTADKLRPLIDWFQRDIGRQPLSAVEQQAKTMFNATEAPANAGEASESEPF